MQNHDLRRVTATLLLSIAACGDKNDPADNEVSKTPVVSAGTKPTPASAPESTPDSASEPNYHDYTGARDVVLEPNTPPYNLGGWKADNTVTWEFDVDFEDMRDGMYDIYIEYSSAYTDAEVWGTAIVSADDDPRPYLYEFQAENTSSGEGDWSEYEMLQIGYGRIYSGATYELEMYPGTSDAALSGEYFINLRRITFVPTDLNIAETHAVTNTAAPVAFEGKWYSCGTVCLRACFL